MFSRRTSARTRKSRERMLHLKVNSPRIMFFDCVKFCARFMKLGIAILIMVGVGIGLSYGWQKLFVENAEFEINNVKIFTQEGGNARFLTRHRFKSKTGIELSKTIFAIDTDELQASIEALPEIKSAKVSRRLPGVLKIEVEERRPIAWVACRSLKIKERDRESGLLVDEDGIAFRCDSGELWEVGEKLPVVMVQSAERGQIDEGHSIEHEGLNFALELVKRANEKFEGIERPAWVVVKDEIMLEMKTLNGILATFSYYDQERQINNLEKLVSHAELQGKSLAKVNLIPRRFVPIHYR
ncbi:MAG: FtsQ-type POTRA domain-containing protein [Akkermansiaceae bacterium]|nr:FtsQ-type POTRA domain-containing protein [Akkermansiaceae bacterium]